MDIAQIRDQLPGLKFGVYLNTGGIGQSPVCVIRAMAEGYQQMLSGSIGPADQYTAMERAASEMPARIAEFFGADPGEIALTMSTGEGYGMVLGGLSWQPGDEVIITNEEHPVPLQAAEGLADRVGAVVKVVEIDQDKNVLGIIYVSNN
ncbi:MAG: aminotransferase class V-fold PLP-dependent enzyme [Gemmatimonadota bacterium]|nr:aminotransferase class V-fold PLP-dependent enzyme [Gemmatimonadota bacterium]